MFLRFLLYFEIFVSNWSHGSQVGVDYIYYCEVEKGVMVHVKVYVMEILTFPPPACFSEISLPYNVKYF